MLPIDYRNRRLFLIAEYCAGPFYMGWHLYLRESRRLNRRNADGSWGWTHRLGLHGASVAKTVFKTLGIAGRIENGSSDGGAIAEFARRFRLRRSKAGGRARGCVEVIYTLGDGLVLAKAPSTAKETRQKDQ